MIGEERFQDYAQGEDALFNLGVILRCSRKVTIPECLYNYLQRSDSSTHKTPWGHERDVIVVWKEIERKLEMISPEICPKVREKVYSMVLCQYREALRRRPPHWRNICRRIKKDYIVSYRRLFGPERPMTGRQKIGFAVFRLSPRFYFWYIYDRKESE